MKLNFPQKIIRGKGLYTIAQIKQHILNSVSSKKQIEYLTKEQFEAGEPGYVLYNYKSGKITFGNG